MELLGIFLAGLGLYFAGIKGISHHFKKLSGDRLRRVLAQATKDTFRTSCTGVFAGGVTQSPIAVMFMTMSMVTTGLIDRHRSLLLTSWAAVGSSGFVLLASFDIYILILYLLGGVGLCYCLNLDEKERYQHLVGALLGISLLFLGLTMIKSSALAIKDAFWLTELLAISASSIPLLMIVGALLGFILQSVITVSVIAVALTTVQLLDLDSSLIIVLGSNIGSLILLLMTNRTLSGTSRQILLVRFWVVLIGVTVTLAILLIDRVTPLTSPQDLLVSLGLNTGTALALGFLLLQLNSAFAFSIFGSRLFRIAEINAPPDPQEELSKPLYISTEYAKHDPEAAVDLTEMEIERLVARLPNFLDSLRPDDRQETFYNANLLHSASDSILSETSQLVNNLMAQSLNHATLERLLSIQARNDLLKHLQDGCYGIERVLSEPFPEKFTKELSHQIVEGLHAVLFILADTVTEKDDPSILLTMTSDRSALMSKIRSGMLESNHELSDDSKARLFEATTLFERVIWLAHRYAEFLARAHPK